MYSLFILALLFGLSQAQFQSFLSRPDITGAVNIQILAGQNATNLAPGYYFITPYVSDFSKSAYGGQIVDQNGQLVWYSNETVQVRGMDMHVCDFDNTGVGDHICWNDALPVLPQGGHSAGNVRFFDNSYQQVGGPDYGATNGLPGPDIHELRTPLAGDGNSFIQDSYANVTADLTAWNGSSTGNVWDGCFQEIDFVTRDVLFQWCSLDHVPLNDTYAFMTNDKIHYHNGIDGNGTASFPWDYAHINAIDKDTNGDFVVSLRHIHAIYKIAGNTTQSGVTPGDIIWQLGGHNNSFTYTSPFSFSWQHHASFQSTNGSLYDVTLFDNAFDGSLKQNTSTVSSGKWIQVDEVAMTANLVHQYTNPNNLLVASQGSVQALPNGNVMVGWGAIPYYTEYDINGNVLYHAHFGVANQNAMQSFRSWKYPWVSKPIDSPTILTYAQNCTGETYAYVSWNGATEVAAWRAHTGSNNVSTAAFATLPDVNRTGFETRISLGNFTQFAFIEAIDATGNVIGTSPVNATFVPAPQYAANCTETSCPPGFTYLPANAQTCNNTLPLAKVFSITPGTPPAYSGVPETYEGKTLPSSDATNSNTTTGPPTGT